MDGFCEQHRKHSDLEALAMVENHVVVVVVAVAVAAAVVHHIGIRRGD